MAAHPQLILLDLCLPGIDGEVVCRMLREKTPAPIMVVTSRNTELDELTLLTYGADDFISKPYNPRLLCARVYRLLQRAYEGESSASAILRHNTLVLNLSTCQVSNGAQSATLTKNEMKILALLMNHAGSIVSRQTIQEELWQTDEFVDDNTLTVNMSHVRKRLNRLAFLMQLSRIAVWGIVLYSAMFATVCSARSVPCYLALIFSTVLAICCCLRLRWYLP